MKFTVTKPVEIEVGYVRLELPVRYGTDDIPDDFPLRRGDMWSATINIETGQILDWPVGAPACELSMKVCDQGVYALLYGNKEVARIEEDYVPHGVVPGKYGDYVELEIDAGGVVVNWPKRPSVAEFFPKGKD